jgi:hypothetical protein
MVGDGNDDLEHGVFGHNDEDELPFDIGDDSELFNDDDEELNFELNIDDLMGLNNDEDEIDDEEVEGLFDDLKESLEMFKRFTKYN